MQLQAGLFFSRFRFFLACILTAAFLLAIAALVTSIGSNTVLDSKTGLASTSLDTSTPDSPDAITGVMYSLVNGVQHGFLRVGIALYGGCRSVTTITTNTGDAIGQGSVTTVRGIGRGTKLLGIGLWHGIAAADHGIGSGTLFTMRLPGKLVNNVTNGSNHAVGSIIRPVDTGPIPIITAPSPAQLASMTAQERQEIAAAQAAQVTANRNLNGVVVAGDPSHGGYPAAWDNATQDSMLDSWGMYNRECVSYAAWKVYQTYGNGSMPYWGGVGNANQWPRDARAAGIPTGATPQVHSVAISMRGYYGHAMWVEAVQGNMVYVSQYNYDLHGHYSEMWVNGDSFTYIYFK